MACRPAPPHHLQAVLDMENMFDLLGQHPSIQDAPGAKPLAAPDAGVTLQGVNFQVTAAYSSFKDQYLKAGGARRGGDAAGCHL